MTDIARIKDSDGRTHYTARGSEAAEKLLRDGAEDLDPPTPTEPAAEVADATEPPAQGDDPDTGTAGSGSGQRKRATRTTDRGNAGAGEA